MQRQEWPSGPGCYVDNFSFGWVIEFTLTLGVYTLCYNTVMPSGTSKVRGTVCPYVSGQNYYWHFLTSYISGSLHFPISSLDVSLSAVRSHLLPTHSWLVIFNCQQAAETCGPAWGNCVQTTQAQLLVRSFCTNREFVSSMCSLRGLLCLSTGSSDLIQ